MRWPGAVSFRGLFIVCIVVWVGHVSADRVLSETVVDEVQRNRSSQSQTVTAPARDSIGSMDQPSARRWVLLMRCAMQ